MSFSITKVVTWVTVKGLSVPLAGGLSWHVRCGWRSGAQLTSCPFIPCDVNSYTVTGFIGSHPTNILVQSSSIFLSLHSWYLFHSSDHQVIKNRPMRDTNMKTRQRHASSMLKSPSWASGKCLSWACFASCNIIQRLCNSPQMTLRIQYTWCHGNLHFKWPWGKKKKKQMRGDLSRRALSCGSSSLFPGWVCHA